MSPEETLSVHYDILDTRAILKKIEAMGDDLSVVVLECPTNPFCQIADLKLIAECVHRHGGLLLIDPSIASLYNIDCLPYADVLVTSLTKYTGHTGDIMAGAIIFNEAAADYSTLKKHGLEYALPLYDLDMLALKDTLQSAESYVQTMNANGRQLTDFLKAHPKVKKVFAVQENAHRKKYLKHEQAFGSIISIELYESISTLEEVVITANPFQKSEETHLSIQKLSREEIATYPGGNNDIAKVVQSLPGVQGSIGGFRNDVIIRGGAPNENVYYLDGIEIPNINHFATQGSSGGPVGILNVNFIQEVDFYSGAFPANRGNALSSVMELKQIEGSDEDISASFMLGSSDAGLTINTPLSKNSSLLLSARRSYLQFLFKALQLPFLPTYNDIQLKYTFKPNAKNQFNVIGLAAIDNFSLNPEANEGVDDPQKLA